MAVTNADVARRAGTSTAVVSYVFNNGPRNVAPATKARVLEAAAELGYRPNRLAKSLRTGSSGFMGLLTPDSSNPYYAALNRALAVELGKRGVMTLMSHAGLTGLSEAEALNAFLSAQVDGLAIIWFESEDATLPELSIPVVFVHHRPDGAPGEFVSADNEHATRLGMEHFAVHGVTHPAFWSGLNDVGPTGERVRAWQAVIGDPKAQPIRSAYSREAAFDRFVELHTAGEVPEALIVATGEQALGILAAAYQCGVSIPGDLSIVLLDGSPSTAFTVPPLTVVEQPIDDMALKAIDLLTGVKNDTEMLGELIVRRSCGCDFP